MGAAMQIPCGTDLSPEEYVARQAWRDASPPRCPFHPCGRCQLAGHGAYQCQTPAGMRLRRFRCPRSGQTVSLLPDWPVAHRPGTLAEVEQIGRGAEPVAAAPRWATAGGRPPSVPTAVGRVQMLLTLAKGLYPDRFSEVEPSLAVFGVALGTVTVLARLREVASEHLGVLPPPVGFSHTNRVGRSGRPCRQQATGRLRRIPTGPMELTDSPCALRSQLELENSTVRGGLRSSIGLTPSPSGGSNPSNVGKALLPSSDYSGILLPEQYMARSLLSTSAVR